jgi:PPOX class probable F420-dependent enzyme
MTTIPESHKDLLNGQVAVLGTIGASGRPQLSGVWFLAEDDGTVRMSLSTARQKVKNLQANPKVSLLVFGDSPYQYVELRGDAEITPDPDYVFADRVGAKYGADLRTMDKPGDTRVVVTINPQRVVTWGGAAEH